MNRLTRSGKFGICLALASALCVADASVPASNRFTVADSIEMLRFGNMPLDRTGSYLNTASPDGRYFYVLTTSGNIAQNYCQDILWLFSKTELQRWMSNPSSAPPAGRNLAEVRGLPTGQRTA